jgi:hypothetical protein
LGPDPPPWRKHKIYRKIAFFIDFGVFNRAGKTVSKIGIYSKPPPKSDFYGIFIPMGYNLMVFECFVAKFLPDGNASDFEKNEFFFVVALFRCCW